MDSEGLSHLSYAIKQNLHFHYILDLTRFKFNICAHTHTQNIWLHPLKDKHILTFLHLNASTPDCICHLHPELYLTWCRQEMHACGSSLEPPANLQRIIRYGIFKMQMTRSGLQKPHQRRWDGSLLQIWQSRLSCAPSPGTLSKHLPSCG